MNIKKNINILFFSSYIYLGETMKKLLVLLFLIPLVAKCYTTSAHSVVLMDSDSKRILYESNKDDIRSVASISKIMTAILAIKSDKLNDIVTIGDEVKDAYGSGIYITVGEEITLKELVYGLMLRSGNDAALAIAKYVGGSVPNFVSLMNKKAKEIGMKNTTFNNPSGLDQGKGNYSTAYDMAILMSYAIQNNEFKKIVGTKKIEVKTNKNTYVWINKNKLLSMYKYTTGGKTGYTEKAKRTLVTSASKNGVNLVAVTLVDGNDFNDHKSLYDEAFGKYKNYRILKKDDVKIIGENYYQNCYFYLKDNFKYSLRKDELDKIVIKFELKKLSDYKDGDEVGNVKVYLSDKIIYDNPIYIEKSEKKEGFFKRLINKLW